MKTIILSLALLVAGVSASPTRTHIRMGSDFGDSPLPSVPMFPSLPSLPTLPTRNFIPITRYNQEIVGGVSDATSYSTGNGISLSESTRVVPGVGGFYEGEHGELIKSDSSLVKSGSYSYTGADGTPVSMSWTADEKGFHATGTHIPTPPPVPEEHRAALLSAPVAYGSYSAPAPLIRISDYAAPVFRSSVY